MLLGWMIDGCHGWAERIARSWGSVRDNRDIDGDDEDHDGDKDNNDNDYIFSLFSTSTSV